MRTNSRTTALWLLFGLLMASPRPGGAQTIPATAPANSGGTQQQIDTVTDYLLGADDVIEVTVGNHSDLNKVLTIPPDGKIDFPEIGEIQAAGKTPHALAALIQQAVEKTRNNVSVIVSVKEVHSRRVRALGALKGPGAFDLKRNWRLMDLVAAAGGLAIKPAQISARIVRNGSQVIPLDLAQALAAPEGSANVALEPDDLLMFDELEPVQSQAYVMGQVAKPGAYTTDAETNLLSLLSLAGNATEHAALTKAYVLRMGTRIPLNLRPLLVEGRADADVSGFKVHPGDMLFVPENDERYAVMGQVTKPGYYPLPEKGEVTLLEAINLAGGQGATGDLAKAGIIHVAGGKATVQPVNIDTILKKGHLAENVVLHSGDILYVPERSVKHGFTWQDLLTPLSALSILGVRLR
jgi:polysaccharide export outer membrane protein